MGISTPKIRKRILVTGANGLLGQKLVDQLSRDENFELHASGRGDNRNPEGNYLYYRLDITDGEAIGSLFQQIKPEVVIHTAAMTQVDDCELRKDECWKQNVTAVTYLVKSCEQHAAFLIHLSTDFIFDGASGPYHEKDTPNPLSYYGESKLASEKLVQQMKSDWAIVRTMLVYGIVADMSRSNIILWVKSNLEQGKKIRVVNDQWRMPTLAEDLATGCILIARKQAKGIFHISGKDLLNPYQMAIHTASFYQLDQSLIEEVDGSVFTQPAKRPARTGFILDKAYSELGYSPHSFQAGIQIVANQVRNRN